MNIKKITKSKITAVCLFVPLILMVTAGCHFISQQTANPPSNLGEPGQKADIQLEAVLSIPEEIPLCSPIELEFTVTNQSNEAVYLLNWYTPLEGVLGDIFRVTYDGQELDYLGPQVTRAAPLAEQYVLIEAGKSKSAVVDLSTVYDFSQPGKYEIAFKSPSISHVVTEKSEFAKSPDALGPVQIPSNPVAVKIVSENGEACQSNVGIPAGVPEDQSTPKAPLLTLTGVVKEVSLSAQIIWLEEEVDGFSCIVLTEDSEVKSAIGETLALDQIQQGIRIEVSGKPGENKALIADGVWVIPSD